MVTNGEFMSFRRSLEQKARRELKKKLDPKAELWLIPDDFFQYDAVLKLLQAILPPNHKLRIAYNKEIPKEGIIIYPTYAEKEAEALLDTFTKNKPFPTTLRLFDSITEAELAEYLHRDPPETNDSLLGRMNKQAPRTTEGTAATARYFSKKLSEKE